MGTRTSRGGKGGGGGGAKAAARAGGGASGPSGEVTKEKYIGRADLAASLHESDFKIGKPEKFSASWTSRPIMFRGQPAGTIESRYDYVKMPGRRIMTKMAWRHSINWNTKGVRSAFGQPIPYLRGDFGYTRRPGVGSLKDSLASRLSEP